MLDSASPDRLITFFGGAAIQVGDIPVRSRATHRHPLALLALLVANAGKPITRDKLIAYLWPERDAEAARNLLKVNVHELRKELGDGAIRSIGDQLSADVAALTCDLSEFLAAVARGDDDAAAQHYTGAFLDGFFLKDAVEFERWVDAERTRLGALYASAVERLADRAALSGDRDDALRWRRAHAAQEPYRPDVAERLVDALAASGNAEAAVQFAATFAERRLADLGISDDERMVTRARQLASVYTPTMHAFTPSADMSVLISSAPAPNAARNAGRSSRRRWAVAAIGASLVFVVGVVLARARTAVSPGVAGGTTAIETMARAAGEPDDRIAGLVDRPASAARDYIAAEVAYRAARYTRAESLYARALTADSTFGVAGLGLSLANSWTGINEHYGIGRDAAMRYQAGMSPRDRAFAQAFFGPDPALGASRPAPVYLTAWEDVVEKWPDWTEAWYQLGDRYYHFGGLSGLADADGRARSAFRHALSQDSTFAAPLHHLIELDAADRDTSELRVAGARYFAANPTVDRDRSAIGWEMATALGDSVWLGRLRANFGAMPREDLVRIGWVTDANGWPRADALRAAAVAVQSSTVTSVRERSLISLLALQLNAGQSAAARETVAGLGALFPDAPVAALWDLYAALFGDGDSVLATAAAGKLASFALAPASGDHVRRDQQHQAACLVGYRDMLRGDVAAAQAAADRVDGDLAAEDNGFARRNATVCLTMLRATIAERTHSPNAGALAAELDTILLRQRVPPHVVLETATIASARIHAALGDSAAALVAARRREHLTGDPIFLSTELREEATYARATGARVDAERALAHLAALRREH